MRRTTIPIFEDLPNDFHAVVSRLFEPGRPTDDLVRLYHQLRNLAPMRRSAIEQLGRPCFR